jgi:cardiolipin synthase A/B
MTSIFGHFVPFNTMVLTVVQVTLAAGVTAHALAHKRDPGSAVAWIGLAWLSPVVGSVLYLLLGINRVQRRARGLRPSGRATQAAGPAPSSSRDDHLAPLEVAAHRISGRDIAVGNTVAMLQNGDAAYPQMIAAIDAAQVSVALSSYIFAADAAGNRFIEALTRAQGRGVEVRVLIDGYGGGYFWSRAYRRLRHAGVPVARFLHSALPWRMPFLNLRTHRKILVTDGRIAFMGGLNIAAVNLISLNPRHPVLDTHFRFAGPIVAQLGEAFAEQWRFTTGETLTGAAWFPPLEPVGDSVARAVTSGPDQDLEKIELLVLEAIGCARSSIQIMTPYFLPDDRIITALALAALRGVEVDIVLPEHSNHPTVDWAMWAHIDPLLVAGCRVWTHSAPFNHSKLMTVDGMWCFVGSANWDTRSFTLNFEINVEVYCSATVEQVSSTIAAHQTNLITMADLGKRSLPVRLRDRAARLMLPYL